MIDLLFNIVFIVLAAVVLAPFLAAIYYSILILKRSKHLVIKGLFAANIILILSFFPLPLAYPMTFDPLLLLAIGLLGIIVASAGKLLAKKYKESEIEKMATRAALLQVIGLALAIIIFTMTVKQVPR